MTQRITTVGFATLLSACSLPLQTAMAPAERVNDNPAAERCLPTSDAGKGTSQPYVLFRGNPVYLRGFNIAWFEFARDVGRGLNQQALHDVLADVRASGGNSVRWWIHTDGSQTPDWDTINGFHQVSGPGGSLISDLTAALDIAAEYEVYLIPSLWSFDMLNANGYRLPPNDDNYRLLNDDRVLQSYLDNALVPMVKALNAHPALLAWELFNEPENMTEPWFTQKPEFYGGPAPTLERLQRVQGLMAATIHETALSQGQRALVTTGSKSLGKYNSDIAGGIHLYRDDRLIAAADDNPHATLDFYAPHYYNNEHCNGRWSPFHHPAAHWNLDKPIVIGEFYAQEDLTVLGKSVHGHQLCYTLNNMGYAGGWAWQWNEYREALMACEQNNKIPKP